MICNTLKAGVGWSESIRSRKKATRFVFSPQETSSQHQGSNPSSDAQKANTVLASWGGGVELPVYVSNVLISRQCVLGVIL